MKAYINQCMQIKPALPTEDMWLQVTPAAVEPSWMVANNR